MAHLAARPGTVAALRNYFGMIRYRFVTPHRAGKWYPDLATAQRHACEIGAGFLAERSGEFCAYCETRLEVAPTEADRLSGSGTPA